MEPVALAKPIEAHGETLKALSFREPTGKDIREIGVPFTLIADPNDPAGKSETKFDAPVIAKYIARLANVPPSAVDTLGAQDWLLAMAAVASFFGAPVPSSSTATSTPPATGATSDTSST